MRDALVCARLRGGGGAPYPGSLPVPRPLHIEAASLGRTAVGRAPRRPGGRRTGRARRAVSRTSGCLTVVLRSRVDLTGALSGAVHGTSDRAVDSAQPAHIRSQPAVGAAIRDP